MFVTGPLLYIYNATIAGHPAGAGKHVEMSEDTSSAILETDLSLVLRVLTNMILNALEATEDGEAVKVWAEGGERDRKSTRLNSSHYS